MCGDIPPPDQYAFMAWCSVKNKHRDNLTFVWTVPSAYFPLGGQISSLLKL